MLRSRQTRLYGAVRVLALWLIVSYCVFFAARHPWWSDFLYMVASKLPRPLGRRPDDSFSPELLEFWKRFEEGLQDARPSCTVTYKEEKITPQDQAWGDGDEERLNAEPRPDYIDISDDDRASTKAAHEKAVLSAHQHASELYFRPGTMGIATTAGGTYIPVLLVSLRMLRQTGSTLPVEVFLATWGEYDFYTCEQVLPALGAHCRVLSDVWSTTPALARVESYQLKVFALLYSSFEHVLFLDADAFPVHDPAVLFAAEPYRSTGLVTWPDFWASTTHAAFYDIAGVEESRVPARDARRTSESGEILLGKRQHAATLLLATYYNYYGPDCYYPLLSQGAAGEGDKETFLHAALALNASFWDVKARVQPLGSHQSGEWMPAGMIQHDPVEDYAIEMQRRVEAERKEKIGNLWDALVLQIKAGSEKKENGNEKDSKDLKGKDRKRLKYKHTASKAKMEESDENDGTEYQETGDERTDERIDDESKADVESNEPEDRSSKVRRGDDGALSMTARPFFIHHNNHKLDPRHVLDADYHMEKENGAYRRLWNTKEWTIKTFGYDLERKVCEAEVVTGCEIDSDTCERLKDYWRKIFYEDDWKERREKNKGNKEDEVYRS